MTFTYKLGKNDPDNNMMCIIRKEDNAAIPLDINNTDYQEYLEWAKTNTAEPAD
jgi:hypothetical protein|tara:strand:+ start:791 stop:952 length:162 start_codon:yes stop_codon:yes gene_type:complete